MRFARCENEKRNSSPFIPLPSPCPLSPFLPPLHVFLCKPGFEQALLDEIQQEWTSVKAHSPSDGWCVAEFPHNAQFAEATSTGLQKQNDWTPVLAWAKQTFPNAASLTAPSINAWAELIGQRIIAELKGFEGPWRLHLFAHPVSQPEAIEKQPNRKAFSSESKQNFASSTSRKNCDITLASPRRAELIFQAVLAFLKHKQKRLVKSLMVQSLSKPLPDERVIQVGLASLEQGWWSNANEADAIYWRHSMSRYPAGNVVIVNNKDAPARAFAKLAEAERHLGRSIQKNESCVDLGASPGSWTWHAAKSGALITAIDRSPLRADLMRNKNITFQKGDAFKFQPPRPVDWLLCDVAAFPDRILVLLDEWLTKKLCRNFIVTIKFRGSEDYKLLREAKQLLLRHDCEFLLRNMNANKNEVTAMGRIPESK
jgi:23S rRNA (cytidine2498-2'-O)-methyltransferase